MPIKSAQETSSVEGINNHSTPKSARSCVSGKGHAVSFQCTNPSEAKNDGRVEAPTVVSTQTSVGANEIISGTSLGCGGGVSMSETVHQRLRHVEAVDNTMVSNAPNKNTSYKFATSPVNAPVLISNDNNGTGDCIVSASSRNKKPLDGSSTRTQDLNSEWQIVQKKSAKRYKLIGQKGSANITPSGKFKAADVKVPLFISNVSKETCEQDIISYIKEKTNETVSLKLIKMKTSKKYNAYKLFVSKYRLDLFLRDDFWPNGITFRRFVHFMYGTTQESRKVIADN